MTNTALTTATLCLDNAFGWLTAAQALVRDGDGPRASVLYALAVLEVGKGIEVLRGDILGDHPVSAIASPDNRRRLETATEIIDRNDLCVGIEGQEPERWICDLLERFEGLMVGWSGEDVKSRSLARFPANDFGIASRR